MTSEAKVAANRRNAERSTGPRSPEGKARSAANAIVHGLTAARMVLPGEDAAAFTQFVEEGIAELEPVGAMEMTVAHEIISYSWRLRRVPWIETGVIRRGMAELCVGEFAHVMLEHKSLTDAEIQAQGTGPEDLGRAVMTIDAGGFFTERLPRHEGRLARRRERAFALFFSLQTRRRREDARRVNGAEAGPIVEEAEAPAQAVESVPETSKAQNEATVVKAEIPDLATDHADQSPAAAMEGPGEG